MIYYKLSEKREMKGLHVAEDLFAQKIADYAKFSDAKQRAVTLECSSNVKEENARVDLLEGNWVTNLNGKQDVFYPLLRSCAAVLIYAMDFDNQLKLFAAGHPAGGAIPNNTLSFLDNGRIVNSGLQVEYVVYATPSLDENIVAYTESIESLALRCGTDKLCVVSGFQPRSVYANASGGITI